MAQDEQDSIIGRLYKLVSPKYDLAGKKKDSDEPMNTEAGRKYVEAADAEEAKMLAEQAERKKVGKRAPQKKAVKPRSGVLASRRTPRKRG